MMHDDEAARVLLHDNILHPPYKIPTSHKAPLTIAAARGEKPVISGGVPIPLSLFEPDPRPGATPGTLVADLRQINVTADDLGSMIAGSCINECQHNTSSLSYNGELMTLARWPNVLNSSTTGWQWAHASQKANASAHSFILDDSTGDARTLRWAKEEADPWLTATGIGTGPTATAG